MGSARQRRRQQCPPTWSKLDSAALASDEMKIRDSRARRLARVEQSPIDIGAGEVCAVQLRAGENSLPQVRAAQVDVLEVRVREDRLARARSDELGVGEVGSVEMSPI